MTSFAAAVLSVCVILTATADMMVQAECRTKHLSTGSEVNCSGSDLAYVPWDIHSNIKVLDLSNNKLTQLSSGVFNKYTSLERLYLRNNQISKLDNETFSKLIRLKNLDLSSNHFARVPVEALNLPELSLLSLQGNRLTRIENRAFAGLQVLKILHLNGNHINSIQTDAFEGLQYLQILELQNNALQDLPEGVLRHCSSNLLTLRLYYNPWFCDCRIHWLKQWFQNNTGVQWEFPQFKPECDGPAFIRQMPFSQVSLNNFACPPEMYSSSDKMVLQPGSSPKLLCKFFSMPETRPRWYKNKDLIREDTEKYDINEHGVYEKTSVLKVTDFQEEDIALYTCEVENTRGSNSIEFIITLEGIDFASLFTSPKPEPLGAGVDMKNVVISVSIVCGLILLTVSIILIVCLTSRYRRQKAIKKEEIAKEIKDHFLTNGDLSMKSLDHLDDVSLTISNHDSNTTKEKLSEHDDSNLLHTSLSNICRPSSPTGHTYMSFDSELTDNDELTQIYSAIRSPKREGSHTESTTPLLEHYAPSSVFDSREPLDNSSRLQSFSSVPRNGTNYWSNNNLPRTPGSMRSNTIYNDPSYLYGTNPYPRNYRDYGDYRDYRYPTPPPQMQRIHSTKKSASVGNLGLPQRTPAPRKPPRVNRSGERMSDSVDDTNSEIGRTMTNSSFNGITPGTPV
ncbi:leucine-rich repeat-containing protein 24-like [Haliotis cracherodii]|uniref:leucine-rich repeat-containing protein 24-like n=1 Tax=Haliotis cracherodii TaxID=6455 RepID=UPI0039E8934F